jgi:GNAT superfamily N-acetyltransferase
MTLVLATEADIPALAVLHAAVAEELTRRYGRGHWSSSASERGVAYQVRLGHVYVERAGGAIQATLRLATRKPWSIDVAPFTPCARPLYLTDMAVAPDVQGRGYGRRALADADAIAAAWPADAIRLDAYDAEAGAGVFYARCGYREVGRASFRGTGLVYFERYV